LRADTRRPTSRVPRATITAMARGANTQAAGAKVVIMAVAEVVAARVGDAAEIAEIADRAAADPGGKRFNRRRVGIKQGEPRLSLFHVVGKRWRPVAAGTRLVRQWPVALFFSKDSVGKTPDSIAQNRCYALAASRELLNGQPALLRDSAQ